MSANGAAQISNKTINMLVESYKAFTYNRIVEFCSGTKIFRISDIREFYSWG